MKYWKDITWDTVKKITQTVKLLKSNLIKLTLILKLLPTPKIKKEIKNQILISLFLWDLLFFLFFFSHFLFLSCCYWGFLWGYFKTASDRSDGLYCFVLMENISKGIQTPRVHKDLMWHGNIQCLTHHSIVSHNQTIIIPQS